MKSSRFLLVVIFAFVLSLMTACTTVTVHDHEYSDWTFTTAPSETEGGIAERVCECGDVDREFVSALNDTSVWSGAKLLKTYGKKLKSDVVQMAHHGQAGADKDVYEAIDASIRLWPVPFWVWQNEVTYKIGEVRSWFGIDENVGRETDLVSCKYGKYPEDYTSIDSWKQCLDVMKIVL